MSLKDLVGITEDRCDLLQCQMPSIGEEKPGTDCKDISRDNETKIEPPANISVAIISIQLVGFEVTLGTHAKAMGAT